MNKSYAMASINYHGPVVIFDLDDTLFRERDFCRSGFAFLCNKESYLVGNFQPYPTYQTLKDLEKEMDRLLTARENPFEVFEQFFRPLIESAGEKWDLQKHIKAYRNHLPAKLKAAEGAIEFLEHLSNAGIRMGIITDGRSVTQRNKIKALGINKFFDPDLIFISEETGCDKHSKEMFARVVRHYPEASTFYYIGDNVRKDFFQPNIMGWTTIKIAYNTDNVHPYCESESGLHEASLFFENYFSLKQYSFK